MSERGENSACRRALPRAEFRRWVDLSSHGQRRRVTGLDLSSHGIGLSSPNPIPARALVKSEFFLPRIEIPLELDGIVMWCDPVAARLGVRFQFVEPSLAELIANYVAGRL